MQPGRQADREGYPEIAEAFNKKVAIEGRSMKTNMEVVEAAGLFKYKKGTLITIEEVDN